jgi:predicted signal transduction protein with EAL and GGDEF domain
MSALEQRGLVATLMDALRPKPCLLLALLGVDELGLIIAQLPADAHFTAALTCTALRAAVAGAAGALCERTQPIPS